MAGMKIRKGDRVRVLAGKDRGAEGVVMFALPAQGKVIVEGVNLAKKHQKPTRSTQQGGIIEKDMPMPVSNVAIICPSCGGPSKIGFRFEPDGSKVRICRKCRKDLP
jgi:large subunit ribosomal protein L24